jgi:hypothetical protein
MQTIQDINNALQNIVDNHDQLKSFHTYTIDTLDMEKLNVTDYPLLYGQCTGATMEGGATVFTFEIIVGDLVIEKQQEVMTEVYTETYLILQDVVSQFVFNVSQSSEISNTWSFELPLNCTPFTARFDNLLTGWSTQFDIRLPTPLNLCIAPYD